MRKMEYSSDTDCLSPLSLNDQVPEFDPCVLCGRDPTWVCVQCGGGVFCTDCWDKQWAHKKIEPQARMWRSRPVTAKPKQQVQHEKVNREIYYRFADIFDNTTDDDERLKLHAWEAGAKWFGITRDSNTGQFRFGATPRFREIMMDGFKPGSQEQFPSLVSFIGQTGAGKSTMIRMLIALQQSMTSSSNGSDLKFIYPIAGTSGESTPTTGDVQLYPDPGTRGKQTPLLFADCEGLDGGGKMPTGLEQRDVSTLVRKSHKLKDITWTAQPDRCMKREDVVLRLFPKILYTFSDVVVFVLKEARTLESVVSRHLIPWAHGSIYTSLNQAILPHLIITLNAVDSSIKPEEWTPEAATEKYLNSLDIGFEDDSNLRRLASDIDRMSGGGREHRITTIKQLLQHYYATVTFIPIPEKLYFGRMDQQVTQLYCTIAKSCSSSFEAKRDRRMAPNGDNMELLLSRAFDHFSETPNEPFNFLSESLKQNPIQGTFAGNLLQFILTFQKICSDHDLRHDSTKLLDALVPVISSCILLDAEKGGTMGNLCNVLRQRHQSELRKAFDVFCELWLPCTYEREGVRCCNFKSAHGKKGHQRPDGKLFGFGAFESNFKPDDFFPRWMKKIQQELDRLNAQLSCHRREGSMQYLTKTAIAARIHRNQIDTFLSSQVRDIGDFVSQKVCLVCLGNNMPEHPLPCGHTLCTACVDIFCEPTGLDDEDVVRFLASCPLHPRDPQPIQIRVKPPNAGLRILCFHGGGIRGIIQLAILQEIEREFEGHMRIQSFFDLVVGTSTGGIVALGVFVNNQPVSRCIRDFKDLCPVAFTPRELSKIPVLRTAAMVHHGSEYKTRPFESLLQKTFGSDRLLFGGQDSNDKCQVRVALTSTDTTVQHQPVILTNYNRPHDNNEGASYAFVRYDTPQNDMKIWEAARATSAAFPYFKTLVKQGTGREFCDGGLFNNCPVKVAFHERRLLWDDARHLQPDILLSLGTGRNPSGWPQNIKISGDSKKSHFIKKAWRITAGVLENILECQTIWDDFLQESTEQVRGNKEFTSRYLRLNVEVPTGVPKLNEAKRVRELENLVLSQGIPNSREVAHRLIASSFYCRFMPISRVVSSGPTHYEIHGEIRCRFPKASKELKGLGSFLKGCFDTDAGFKPSFLIQRDYNMTGDPNTQGSQSSNSVELAIKETLISDMCDTGVFYLPFDVSFSVSSLSAPARLAVRLQHDSYTSICDSWLSISGFPRGIEGEVVMDEIPVGSPRLRAWSRGTTAAPPPYSVNEDSLGALRDGEHRRKQCSTYE
ncbi:hypothetical protein QBC41DRAFT_97026 [Cercophora samala]|uniref:FabD/lysophospholipase-like protein n=1 Tax=Cercophora samala TaxID=330535 RepID=A0AA40DB74_9PEZI|nr:hypothetical protein QBC41DRAFT_97026 [Cercophora samala]